MKERELPLYIVDAFTAEPFRGNPAAVVVQEEPADDRWMLAVAREMNLSETAFVRRLGEGHYALRWFTPKVEMDLCGHATLGTAAALFAERGETAREIAFDTRSGRLTVARGETAGRYVLDFPVQPPRKTGHDPLLFEALGVSQIEEVSVAPKSFVVVEVAESVDLTSLAPSFTTLGQVKLPKEAHGVIITRRGPAPYDFTSRMFAPWIGIDEDPVTGAAHTVLAPYWSERLGKKKFRAFQASPRGGELDVTLTENGRVLLEGSAVTVVKGVISA